MAAVQLATAHALAARAPHVNIAPARHAGELGHTACRVAVLMR